MKIDRDTILKSVAVIISLLYCAFPVLLSLGLLGLIDGDIIELFRNYLAIKGVNPLQSLLVPVLGAITIFKGDELKSGLTAILLAILLLAFGIAFFGYVAALGDRAALFLPEGATNLDAPSQALKSFLESTSLQILILLGLRAAGDLGQQAEPQEYPVADPAATPADVEVDALQDGKPGPKAEVG
jgi:hypothetical protein